MAEKKKTQLTNADLKELQALFEDLFTLSNRYQMWLHQTFPWKLSVFFPKKTLKDIQEDLVIAQRLSPTPSTGDRTIEGGSS